VIVLTARDDGDGFFSCSLADLEQADVAIKSVKALAKTENVEPVPARELHISAEERKRALAFVEWHSRQMHPSDRAAIVMFNSRSMVDCQFTAADVRNARALFGPCPACTEGKMVAPPQRTSTTEPAHQVGEVLHGDFIFLKQTSVGGNNIIFFTVDEFSGLCKGVPGKSKAAAAACAMATVAEFNAFQHQVRRMHTDSEAVLKAMKKPLGMTGVHLKAYPPGLFEKRAERSIQTVKARKRTGPIMKPLASCPTTRRAASPSPRASNMLGAMTPSRAWPRSWAMAPWRRGLQNARRVGTTSMTRRRR
jgi:hypothetical protein